MARRLLLYPFDYYDPIRRRWVRARYVAELSVIAERYEASRIVGPPEIREGDGTGLTAGHVMRGSLG